VFIRYNAVSQIWEYDSSTSASERAGDPRAVWLPLPIDYSQLVNVPPIGQTQLYTPVWATNGVQPVLGNGQLSGVYSIIGKVVTLNIFFNAGTTTNPGTGIWGFSLPTDVLSIAYVAGTSFCYRGAAGTMVIGGIAHGGFFIGGALANSIIIPTPTGLVTNANPFDWTSSPPNYMFLQMTYQRV